MAYLLDLPNELLYKICSFISGEELKTFCASNRQIYNISKPIMATHRALWAKFEVLVDTPNTSVWFWHNLTTSLLSGSPGAPYIREIRTEHFEQHDVFNGDQSNDAMFRDWDIASDSEILKPLQKMGGLSRRLRPAFANDPPSFKILDEVVRNNLGLSDIERRKWGAGIRRGEISGILYPLLPNLRTLKIEASSSVSQDFIGNAMKDAALAHHLKRPCEAFGKLTSVDLTSNRQEFDMDFLATIMALPSMRKIAASKVAAGRFTRKYELPASNVTEIAFLSQDTSPDSFVDLLQGGPPLSSIHIGSWGFPQFFDEGMFGEVLLANAQDSFANAAAIERYRPWLKRWYQAFRTSRSWKVLRSAMSRYVVDRLWISFRLHCDGSLFMLCDTTPTFRSIFSSYWD